MSAVTRGSRVGSFVVESPIGRGGMGEVYRAQRANADFDQHVALKLIHAGTSRLEHFEPERRILAGLEHPNIARLIDGGVADDGRPYMAMEYVDGQDILAYALAHALDAIVLKALRREPGARYQSAAHLWADIERHRQLRPVLARGDGRG